MCLRELPKLAAAREAAAAEEEEEWRQWRRGPVRGEPRGGDGATRDGPVSPF